MVFTSFAAKPQYFSAKDPYSFQIQGQTHRYISFDLTLVWKTNQPRRWILLAEDKMQFKKSKLKEIFYIYTIFLHFFNLIHIDPIQSLRTESYMVLYLIIWIVSTYLNNVGILYSTVLLLFINDYFYKIQSNSNYCSFIKYFFIMNFFVLICDPILYEIQFERLKS